MGKNIVLAVTFIVVLLLILIFFMSDTTSTNTNTNNPKDIARKFLTALAKKDLQAAKLYSTTESKTLLVMIEKALYKNNEEIEVQQRIIEQIEEMNILCQQYENKAVCNCGKSENGHSLELDLVKENNVWLVKVNMNFFVTQGKGIAQRERKNNHTNNRIATNKPLTKGSSSSNKKFVENVKIQKQEWNNKANNFHSDNDTEESEDIEPSYTEAKFVPPIRNPYVFSWVDRARLRTAPNLDSETIHFVSEGEMLKTLGQRSRHTSIVELRGTNYEAYWIKVQTVDGLFEGWIFEGAVQ